jgi:hypothetical protein
MTDFLSGLAARVAALTPEETAVARHCFRALLAGRPAIAATIPESLGLDADRVTGALAALCRRGSLAVDETGTVTVARGLSAPATPHRLAIGDTVVHACCAVDAIGIPAALGADAVVQSRCHACGTELTVVLRGGVVTDMPPSIVIWAADLEPDRSVREHT